MVICKGQLNVAHFCEYLYLDADNLMRDCMSAKGYSFVHSIPACPGGVSYYSAECFRPSWWYDFANKAGRLVQTF